MRSQRSVFCQTFQKSLMMRRPGFEPGLLAWKAKVMPLDHRRFLVVSYYFGVHINFLFVPAQVSYCADGFVSVI